MTSQAIVAAKLTQAMLAGGDDKPFCNGNGPTLPLRVRSDTINVQPTLAHCNDSPLRDMKDCVSCPLALIIKNCFPIPAKVDHFPKFPICRIFQIRFITKPSFVHMSSWTFSRSSKLDLRFAAGHDQALLKAQLHVLHIPLGMPPGPSPLKGGGNVADASKQVRQPSGTR
jgi:hypothetical protein